MTTDEICTYCGAAGHSAARCKWNSGFDKEHAAFKAWPDVDHLSAPEEIIAWQTWQARAYQASGATQQLADQAEQIRSYEMTVDAADMLRQQLAEAHALMREMDEYLSRRGDGEAIHTGSKFHMAIDALLSSTAQPADSGWIQISDRLPDLDTPVWLHQPNGTIIIGERASSTDGWLWGASYGHYYDDEGWHAVECDAGDDYEPTHWMPLPAAPAQPADRVKSDE